MADGRRRGGRLLKQKMDAILINGYIIRVNSAVSCFSHMSIAGPSQSADVKAVKDTPYIFPGGAPAGDPHQAIHITIGTFAGDRVRPDPVHIREVQGASTICDTSPGRALRKYRSRLTCIDVNTWIYPAPSTTTDD